MKKEFQISIPKGVFVDFVFSELDQLKRDNYLLEIKVHRQFSDFHINQAGDMEVFFRKPLHQKPVELDRKEFETLLEAMKKGDKSFGFIGFSFAFQEEGVLDLIFAETWDKRSEAVRYDLKMVGDRLEIVEGSLDIVWHL